MTISPAAPAPADAPETITDVPHPPPPGPARPGTHTALATALGAGFESWLGRRRVWALYAAFALYAGAVAVFSGRGDDRSWGIWAAFGYAAAAALAAWWPGRAGRRAALAAMLAARDGTRAAVRFALLTGAAAALTAALLPGHALATLGPAGHQAAIVLLVISGLALAVSLVLRPPADTRAAARRIALGLALMFALSPVTRFGYFAYPIGLCAWTASGRPDAARAPRYSVQ